MVCFHWLDFAYAMLNSRYSVIMIRATLAARAGSPCVINALLCLGLYTTTGIKCIVAEGNDFKGNFILCTSGLLHQCFTCMKVVCGL